MAVHPQSKCQRRVLVLCSLAFHPNEIYPVPTSAAYRTFSPNPVLVEEFHFNANITGVGTLHGNIFVKIAELPKVGKSDSLIC